MCRLLPPVLLATVAMLGGPSHTTAQWQIWLIDTTGSYPSIEVDRNGFAHISYWADGLKYVHLGDSVPHKVDSLGLYSSLELDTLDRPHIAYFDDTNEDLKYAYWDGANWNIEVVDSGNVSSGWVSLALDPTTNKNHISYQRDITLTHAWWDGASWQVEVVDPNPWTGYESSIDLDTNNYPCISHCDGMGNLLYAHWDGSSWNFETVDSDPFYTSLDVSPSGVPHIAYLHMIDPFNRQLRHAWKPDTIWQIEPIPDPGYGPFVPCIALNSAGYPRLAYCVDETLKYAAKNGSWSIQPVGLGGSCGLSLALDSEDKPHIAYCHPLWGLYYAYGAFGVEELQEARGKKQEARLFQNYPNPFSHDTDIAYSVWPMAEAGAAISLKVYDLSGRLVRTLVEQAQKPGNYSVVWDGRDGAGNEVRAGVYFYQIAVQNLVKTRKMVLVR